MIVQSDEWGWVSQRALIVFGVSALLILLFVIRCNTASHPVLDLKLF
jgi:hypothetical protein